MLSGVKIERDTFLDALLLEYQSMRQMSYVASVLLMSPHCRSPRLFHDIFIKTALPFVGGKDTLEEAFEKHFGKK